MERPIARDVKGDAVRPWLRHLGSYAWALAGLAVVLLVATAVLAVVNRQVVVPDEEPWDARLVWAVLSIPAPVIGALISSRRRDNPYGWVWLVMGLGLALQLYMSEYVFLSLHRPGVPLVGVAGILSGVGWATAYFSLPLVLLLYPTGHPPSGRWNVLLRGILLTAATAIGFGVFSPTEGVSPVRNPIQATGVLGGAVETVVAGGTILVLGSTVPAAVSLVARYRSAGPTERVQLKWFFFAAVVFVVGLIVDFFWELEGVGEALKEGLVMALLPVAVAVAILRHRLYDIDRIVSRTVSYAVVTALLVGVYGHAQGHAALLVEDRGVLAAGDMVSDVLVPMPDPGAASPLGDYLAALDLFEQVADGIDVFVPGHGSAGDAVEFRKRIEMDRAYLDSLGDGAGTDDPRITAPRPGWEWVSDFYSWQVQRFGPRHPHG